MRFNFLISLALFLSLFFAARAHAEKVAQLNPQGYINDFAGVIDSPTTIQLTAICAEVDQKAHAQISIVTIKSLEGLEASVFGNQLYKKWGIGYKGENRGALVLLATDDHKYWTEVGYGLEPILPDGKVGGFGREMVPSLRAGDYSGAVLHLTAQIAQVIAADRGVKLENLSNVVQPVEPQNSATPTGGTFSRFFPGGFFVLLFIVVAIIRFLSFLGGHRRGGGWMGGGSGIFLGGGGFGGGGFSSGGGGGGFGGFGGGSSGGGGAGGSW